jgi:hypothetical protein
MLPFWVGRPRRLPGQVLVSCGILRGAEGGGGDLGSVVDRGIGLALKSEGASRAPFWAKCSSSRLCMEGMIHECLCVRN